MRSDERGSGEERKKLAPETPALVRGLDPKALANLSACMNNSRRRQQTENVIGQSSSPVSPLRSTFAVFPVCCIPAAATLMLLCGLGRNHFETPQYTCRENLETKPQAEYVPSSHLSSEIKSVRDRKSVV